jgi:hypothetical protein
MLKTIHVTAVLFALIPVVIDANTPDTSTWVKFTSFTYTGKTTAPLRAAAKQGNVQLQNPLPEKLNRPRS